jgi:hypothetical protein
MRRTAPSAARPPRPHPHRAVRTTDRPFSTMTPTGEHPATTRTGQPPTHEPTLDGLRVHLYRDHSACAPFHSALDRPRRGQRFGRRKTSGPPALPGRESARGQQHGGNAQNTVKASKMLLCKARMPWRRPDCFKPSRQRWKCSSPDTTPEVRATGIRRSEALRPNPSGRWAADNEFAQGDGKAAYSTLDTSNARGMRDRLRGASPMATEGS